MTYLKIFCIFFTVMFFIGFSIGWRDCSKYKFDDYLIRNVKIITNNSIDSAKHIYLCYIREKDTLIRYSVDSNNFADKAEWLALGALGENEKNKYPFITQFGNVKCFFIEAGMLPLGASLLAAAPKSPINFFKTMPEAGNAFKASSTSTKIKYILTGVLATFSGFISGYFLAEKIFEPSEYTDRAIARINNLHFWEAVKIRMFHAYLIQIKKRCLSALIMRDTISQFELQKLGDCQKQLSYIRSNQLKAAYLGKYVLRSPDFLNINHLDLIITKASPVLLKDSTAQDLGLTKLDYVIYILTGLIVALTLSMLTLWVLLKFNISTIYEKIIDGFV